MDLAVFYFYKKVAKKPIEELIAERNQFSKIDSDEFDELNKDLTFKLPNSMDDILDKYNNLRELKKKNPRKKIVDICYLIIDLDAGEEHIHSELKKIEKSKGFIKFLTREDMEKEK
jgi:hypothetical protein